MRSHWEQFRGRFEGLFGEPEVPEDSFDSFIDRQARSEAASFQKDRAFEYLEEFSVKWDNVQAEETAALRAVIEDSSDERPIQSFLRANPKFLVQALAGGHGRFQIAKPKFGAEYVPDFVVAEAHSFGLDWYLVEIESPRADLVRKDGRPRKTVGMRSIRSRIGERGWETTETTLEELAGKMGWGWLESTRRQRG